jgi:hypothetical protein
VMVEYSLLKHLQLMFGMFGSTHQGLEGKVKIHSNHVMSGWPEGSDVCVCVCVC